MKQKTICILAMCLAVLYSIGLIVFANQTNDSTGISSNLNAISFDYEDKIFDNSYVHEIHIEINEKEWKDLKENSLYKECYDSNITIDGETFYHVGIRTKGNVTLIQSIVRDWDRYSFVLEFDAFEESQRYYGLDQLVLNNNICDSSFMRDYLCYDMMRYMGVPAPLMSYSAVYLNDEYLGLYSSIENIQESFALRNFGYDYGNIYKPEQMNFPGMLTGEEQDCKLNLSLLSGENGSVDANAFMGVTDTTVALKYQGEVLSNYSDIWDNAIFNIASSDKHRLVDSIRVINEESDVDDVLFTDDLLSYFAVNTFVLNDDCYTSYAGHNYGLYEEDGKLMIIPWDYDHSLGCMGAASGNNTWTELINTPIDEPLIETTLEERPLLNCLLSNDEYKEQYYELLDHFLSGYVESDYLEFKVNHMKEMLLPYIQKETISEINEEKFLNAIQSNLDFIEYRSKSIRGQLSNEIPSTNLGQQKNPETLIDCSEFISPDSGSLTELLMPKDKGIYFEDLLGTIIPKINTLATLSIIPYEDIVDLVFAGSSEDGMISKLVESGRVNDIEKVRAAIKQLVVNLLIDIVNMLIAPLSLLLALLFAFHYGSKKGKV